MEEFGKNLRFHRKQRRLTQTELASHVGVAPAYVSQIESSLRMPSLKVAGRFAESLDVPLPSLLGTAEIARSADYQSDGAKLDTLRGLLRSVELDLENRPPRLEAECYPGARSILVSEQLERTIRLYVFVEKDPGGDPALRYAHPGVERLHCAFGEVEVLYGQGKRKRLLAGETWEFVATLPHIVIGEGEAVLLSTTTPRMGIENLLILGEGNHATPQTGESSTVPTTHTGARSPK